MAGQGQGGRDLDPGTQLILKDLRDMRLEMRADRRQANEDRRQANEDRRRADDDRRRADEERQRADEERQRADEAWRQERLQADAAWRQERLQIEEERRRESAQAEERRRQDQVQSDERFERVLREFREDSVLRATETQKAFKDIRTVGLSIVKTLNLHTRILQRIERKLDPPRPWRPGQQDGRGA
jgi:hypothetical protein